MGRDRRRASRSRTAWYTGSSGSAVACCCICICAAAFCFRFELMVLSRTWLGTHGAHDNTPFRVSHWLAQSGPKCGSESDSPVADRN